MERDNVVALIGVLKSEEYVETVNGMRFKGERLLVETERKSGAKDEAIVLAETETVREALRVGEAAVIVGAMQTYKNGQTGKVLVYVLAEEVRPIEGENWEYENEVRLTGSLGQGITYRETPYGKHITDMFIKVDCIKKPVKCFIPCISWGRYAKVAANMVEGDEIAIKGRLQSREYIKVLPDGTKETRKCYEVSAYEIEE